MKADKEMLLIQVNKCNRLIRRFIPGIQRYSVSKLIKKSVILGLLEQ